MLGRGFIANGGSSRATNCSVIARRTHSLIDTRSRWDIFHTIA